MSKWFVVAVLAASTLGLVSQSMLAGGGSPVPPRVLAGGGSPVPPRVMLGGGSPVPPRAV